MATALLHSSATHTASQLTRRATCLLQILSITRYARFHPRDWSPRWREAAIKIALTASAARQPLTCHLTWQSTQLAMSSLPIRETTAFARSRLMGMSVRSRATPV